MLQSQMEAQTFASRKQGGQVIDRSSLAFEHLLFLYHLEQLRHRKAPLVDIMFV